MDPTFVTSVASIIVAAVAGFAGFSAQRSAARANVKQSEITTQAAALDQAYERARKFDLETIERQDEELDELRATNTSQSHSIRKLRENDRKQQEEIRELNEANEELQAQVTALTLRLSKYEQQGG